MTDSRYTQPDLAQIFHPHATQRRWYQYLARHCKALSGKDPGLDRTQVSLVIAQSAHAEETTGHEFQAFLQELEKFWPKDLSRYLHFGLTSSDVQDSVLSEQCEGAALLVNGALSDLYHEIAMFCRTTADTVCLGRTHGQPAEPTTWGYRVVKHWFWLRAHLADVNLPTKAAGPCGLGSAFLLDSNVFRDHELEGLPQSQIVSRVPLIALLDQYSRQSLVMEQLALDMRLGCTLGEIRIDRKSGYTGSSSMPSKNNPTEYERICGMAKMLRSNINAIRESSVVWLERDMSHSCVERVLIPDVFHHMLFMVRSLRATLRNTMVSELVCRENIRRDTKAATAAWGYNYQIGTGKSRTEARKKCDGLPPCEAMLGIVIDRARQRGRHLTIATLEDKAFKDE